MARVTGHQGARLAAGSLFLAWLYLGLAHLRGHTIVISSVSTQDSMIMGSDYYETLEECEYVPGE